jgi:hypothetical protein
MTTLKAIQRELLNKSFTTKTEFILARLEWIVFSKIIDLRLITNTNKKIRCACNKASMWYFHIAFNIYTNETIKIGKECYKIIFNIKTESQYNTHINKKKQCMSNNYLNNLNIKNIFYNYMIESYTFNERIDEIFSKSRVTKYIIKDITDNNKYIMSDDKKKFRKLVFFSNDYTNIITKTMRRHKERREQQQRQLKVQRQLDQRLNLDKINKLKNKQEQERLLKNKQEQERLLKIQKKKRQDRLRKIQKENRNNNRHKIDLYINNHGKVDPGDLDRFNNGKIVNLCICPCCDINVLSTERSIYTV